MTKLFERSPIGDYSFVQWLNTNLIKGFCRASLNCSLIVVKVNWRRKCRTKEIWLLTSGGCAVSYEYWFDKHSWNSLQCLFGRTHAVMQMLYDVVSVFADLIYSPRLVKCYRRANGSGQFTFCGRSGWCVIIMTHLVTDRMTLIVLFFICDFGNTAKYHKSVFTFCAVCNTNKIVKQLTI